MHRRLDRLVAKAAPLKLVAAGAVAFALCYVMVGVLTVSRVDRLLSVSSHDIGPTVLDIYRAGGEPLWMAVGWFTINTHAIPVNVANEGGYIVKQFNFVYDGSYFLGVIPGWIGLIPSVACLLVGFAVTSRGKASIVPMSVGAYMTAGYFLALLVALKVFTTILGDAGVWFLISSHFYIPLWLIPTILAPLVFGWCGAGIGKYITPDLRWK